ncbi:unnamed protein product [Amoebophrya sp. A120]|nr:unnamed protein product [Amoebophrya sp. A120]|eukprot:GSA120T00011881001.1
MNTGAGGPGGATSSTSGINNVLTGGSFAGASSGAGPGTTNPNFPPSTSSTLGRTRLARPSFFLEDSMLRMWNPERWKSASESDSGYEAGYETDADESDALSEWESSAFKKHFQQQGAGSGHLPTNYNVGPVDTKTSRKRKIDALVNLTMRMSLVGGAEGEEMEEDEEGFFSSNMGRGKGSSNNLQDGPHGAGAVAGESLLHKSTSGGGGHNTAGSSTTSSGGLVDHHNVVDHSHGCMVDHYEGSSTSQGGNYLQADHDARPRKYLRSDQYAFMEIAPIREEEDESMQQKTTVSVAEPQLIGQQPPAVLDNGGQGTSASGGTPAEQAHEVVEDTASAMEIVPAEDDENNTPSEMLLTSTTQGTTLGGQGTTLGAVPVVMLPPTTVGDAGTAGEQYH